MTVLIIISLVPLAVKEPATWLKTVELVTVSVFIVDYLARWITADFALGKGWKSFVLYPATPMAIIDLITILPVFLAMNDAWRAARALRLFRALRAFRLLRYSRSANAIANVFHRKKDSLVAVLVLATVYILISALVIFNVEPTTFDTYFDALYWAVVSLTTVGYGDLYPVSDIGRGIAMLSSLMGVAVVALPASIITAGYLEEIADNPEAE